MIVSGSGAIAFALRDFDGFFFARLADFFVDFFAASVPAPTATANDRGRGALLENKTALVAVSRSLDLHPSASDIIDVGLQLRRSLELDVDVSPKRVNQLNALVENLDDAIEFGACDIFPTKSRRPQPAVLRNRAARSVQDHVRDSVV